MVLVTFAETKVTRVRADARIEIHPSRSDTKLRGKQKTKSAWSGFEQRRSRWPEGRSTGKCFVKKGACALPLDDIPVIAAFIHPWMSPPLSK
jgi:hypothetical protein